MIDRPQSLHEIAVRTEDLAQFGREFADWLHTLRGGRSRPELAAAIAQEPPSLRNRFPEGAVSDAWLAAYAEHLSERVGLAVPSWVNSPQRVSPEPWFASNSRPSRLRALRDSPPAFKNRNLFTEAVDLPLRLRVGRPPKSAAEKRQTNAERQRRFRARRGVEFQLLREVADRD